MLENFQNCLAVTLGYEGGWSDHPSDPGGATMKGITLATYRRFKPGATKTDLRNISNETVAKIYRTDYWDKVGGDRLAAGVDLATFDAGVNSGPGRARQWLMAAIGGPDHYTVKRVCAKRLGFMRSLAIWNTFGNGWSRRVAGIEAKGSPGRWRNPPILPEPARS
jgi:lysozyme family protein